IDEPPVDRDEWNRLPYPSNLSRVERSNGGGNGLISVTDKDVFGVTCRDKKGKRKELKSVTEGVLTGEVYRDNSGDGAVWRNSWSNDNPYPKSSTDSWDEMDIDQPENSHCVTVLIRISRGLKRKPIALNRRRETRHSLDPASQNQTNPEF
ncbi:hypothetical protein U1Q18_017556, partial [Sarracenia purpurea var. burkii]